MRGVRVGVPSHVYVFLSHVYVLLSHVCVFPSHSYVLHCVFLFFLFFFILAGRMQGVGVYEKQNKKSVALGAKGGWLHNYSVQLASLQFFGLIARGSPRSRLDKLSN